MSYNIDFNLDKIAQQGNFTSTSEEQVQGTAAATEHSNEFPVTATCSLQCFGEVNFTSTSEEQVQGTAAATEHSNEFPVTATCSLQCVHSN